MSAPARSRTWRTYALILALAAVVLLVLAPNAIAAQLGSFIGWLWVSVMSAVTSIIAGLFGVSGH